MGGLPKRAGLFFCSLPWCYCRGSRRKRCCPSGPSAPLHPSHYAALVGPSRLRPRVARVLQDNTAYEHAHPRRPSHALRRGASRLRPRVARALQDNSACDHAHPLHPSHCAALVGPAYGRGWPGSFRTTPLTTMHWGFISSSLTARRPLSGTGYPWACPDGLRC